MRDDERAALFELAREALPDSVNLLAGTSSIGTREPSSLPPLQKPWDATALWFYLRPMLCRTAPK